MALAAPAASLPFIGDPLTVSVSRSVAYPGDVVMLVLSARNSDGSGRTGSAGNLRIDLYDPDNLLAASVTPTEITAPAAAGAYRFAFTFNAGAKLGSYVVVARTTDVLPTSAVTAFSVAAAPPATQVQVQAAVEAARLDLANRVAAAQVAIQGDVAASQAAIESHVDSALADAISWAMDQANVTFHVENITIDHERLQSIDWNLTQLQNATTRHVLSLEEHRQLSPEYTADEAQQSWLDTIGQLAWVIWGLYFVATRFVRPALLRVLVDLVGFGLLALPIPQAQVPILFFAPLAATGWDVFRYTEDQL